MKKKGIGVRVVTCVAWPAMGCLGLCLGVSCQIARAVGGEGRAKVYSNRKVSHSGLFSAQSLNVWIQQNILFFSVLLVK